MYPLAEIGIYIFFYFSFIKKFNQAELEDYPGGFVVYPYIGMFLSINVLQSLFEEFNSGIRWELYTVYNLFDITCCFFIFMLQYEILKRKRAERDNLLISHMIHLQKEQMQTSKEMIEMINIKCHDIKKQISMLDRHIPQDEIDELDHALNMYDAFAHTGNEALDVVLAEKSLFCGQQKIRFEYVVDGECLLFMRPGDVYSLFGNALDNAIEAVMKLEILEKRYIGFRVYKKNEKMVVIHFENYYAAVLDYEGGLPKTTKKDKYYHGFGMKSIQMLTNRYKGTLNINTKEEMFMLNILLPIQGRNAG